jgi:hypothetical protein
MWAVPVELYQHHLVVAKGSIGELSGLNLLIDTGAIPSVVDGRIARKLHIRGESAIVVAFGRQARTQSAVVDGFRIGSFTSGAVRVGVGGISVTDGLTSPPGHCAILHFRVRRGETAAKRDVDLLVLCLGSDRGARREYLPSMRRELCNTPTHMLPEG